MEDPITIQIILEKKHHNKLKVAALKKETNVSKMIRRLVEKNLPELIKITK